MERHKVSLISNQKNPIEREISIKNNLKTDSNFILFCNSEDCTEINGNTHVTIKIEPPVNVSENEHIHLSLNSAEIPYSFYAISETNNSLQYIESDADFITNVYPTKTIVITPGNYSIKELILSIVTQMNLISSHGASYSMTYSNITNKVTITIDVFNKAIKLLLDCDNSIAEHLGFSYSNDFVCIFSTPLISDKVVRIFLLGNIYFRVTNLSFVSNLATQAGSCYITDILAKVPIESAPNTIIYYKPTIISSNRVEDRSINLIEVKLTNVYNELINLNGVRWSFSLSMELETIK